MALKLMMLSLVAMLALPMFMIKPDGKPMMTISDWLPDTKAASAPVQGTANKLRAFAADSFAAGRGAASELLSDEESGLSDKQSENQYQSAGKMYSWKDQRGVMHFSETAPPAGARNVKVSDLPRGLNRLPAVTPRVAKGPSPGSAQQGIKMAFPGTIPHKDIPKLIKDAKQLQKLADQRNSTLQGL